ncbi:Flp pilus assembly protein CpaB [Litorivivens sp.]|uniref:Flp pilus assembly protein CpaB n=1 Tax=Litorivivens sp. TaxID=2020868 RepID=UPI00356A8D0E
MQLRALILLILALVLGGTTVYLMNDYLQKEVSSRQPGVEPELTPVVVARVNLIPGTRLTQEVLKVVGYKTEALPESYFSDVKTVLGSDTQSAPIILREARKGEPILKYILSPYGARGGMPTRIPEDMRAVTIAVNEIKAVAGFALPGDYVDVIHTTDAGRTDEKLVTRIILQNIKLLGVDQLNSETETEPKVSNAATLLVSPFDGQRLILAQKLGELTLMLRNEFDASLIEESVATYKDLLTIEKNRPTRIYKRERRPRVEIIRGLEISEKTVDETDTGAPASTTGGAK